MLRRKTPLRADPEKVRAWKERSRAKLKQTPFKKKTYKFKQRSSNRAIAEAAYKAGIADFLRCHPVCPVTRGATSQIHHSAKRNGGWLLLRRYWIAVSLEGHAWIEANKREAAKLRLMVRITETYKDHVARLEREGKSLTEPIYYVDS
jgi:hypothetical protein